MTVKEVWEKQHYALMNFLSHLRISYLTIALIVLITPPAFYFQILQPCWCATPEPHAADCPSFTPHLPRRDCYDFEATAVHEIGHLLGLDHPDRLADYNTVPTARMDDPGVCTDPDDYLMYEAPADDVDSYTVMHSLTQHPFEVCISEDDLAGLNWLYPACEGVFTVPTCFKSARNIGWLRLFCWVVLPLLITLVFLLLLIACVKRHQRAQLGWYTMKLQEVEENNHKLLKDVIKHEKHHVEREASRRQSRMRHVMEMEAMQLRLETQMEGLARGLDDEDREERRATVSGWERVKLAGRASIFLGHSADRPAPDGGAGERSKSARERPRPKKSVFGDVDEDLFSAHHPRAGAGAGGHRRRCRIRCRPWRARARAQSVDSILRSTRRPGR